MRDKLHRYATQVKWTGNRGEGTRSYTSYARSHEITVAGKPMIPGSSDPAFRGEPDRYNPEELLVASLSACHMLWFLHLASLSGVVVTAYEDEAAGDMREEATGSGAFQQVVLRPRVTITAGSEAAVAAAHEAAHQHCFIARSVNFPVHHEAIVIKAGE